MRLPRWIVGRFDPAQAFMDAERPSLHDHRRLGRGQAYRGGAVFGPGVPGGSRQMTEEELAALRSRAAERRTAQEDSIARVQEHFGDALAVKAGELASVGAVTIATTAGSVEARIIRFSRGDSVLEMKVRLPSHQRTDAKTRLTGDQLTDARTLAGHLTRFIANLGPEVEVQEGPAA